MMESSESLSSAQFPPGFRFHPTDQELITHYLKKKITSSLPPSSSIIAEIDLYKFNPWDLPEKAFFGEGEWFFFSPRQRKYPNGARPNRSAACGYWKATGTDKPILASNGSHCLGVKKALVFYKGRPPKGSKTDWIMQEYRLLDQSNTSMQHKGTMRLDDWVLCRVKHKGSLLQENVASQETFIKSLTQQELRQQNSEEERSNLYGESPELVHGGGFFIEEQQQPDPASSVLDSIKRRLSFGALDELMMLPPSKKMHHFAADEPLSPAEFYSDYQECLEFLI